MKPEQLQAISKQLKDIKNRSAFYAKKFEGIAVEDVASLEDFEKLPFTTKDDLREAYPLGLAAVPAEEIVRIHSSSGTTGTPVIIPYTQKDVDDWTIQFARCYEMAGVVAGDRIHVTPGYGLWTAGIGFQLGAESLGAMVIPMGPGNTEKQLRMMQDLESSVLCATSSYALLLAEEIARQGIKENIKLKRALIGSERWGDKMRKRIAEELGVSLYDIYGLTEIYGPGIGISCDYDEGMHFWDDYLYFEIIDPKTGEVLPDGESGELVITTLCKEGAPLFRYRTHDLTKIMTGTCSCGSEYPRIGTLIGRTDDMVKIKGINIFPAQIDEVLSIVDQVSSEYQFMIDHLNGKDIATLFFESTADPRDYHEIEESVITVFKNRVGITVKAKAVAVEELPRSEKKSNRIFDNRY